LEKERFMSLLHYIEKYDADHGIPRPMTAPHLNAYHAALRCLRTGAEMLWLTSCGTLSAYLIWITANNFKVDFEIRLVFVAGMIFAIFVSCVEAMHLLLPYYRIAQRVTHGSAMWADTAWLKSEGFAREFTASPGPGQLRLGTLPTGHQLVLPADHTMRHLAVFGPPGSGKSATFITTFLRNWAKCGSTIVLDPKGELFEQTASHYQRAYRLDLMEPNHSDYWNFVPRCKGNAELAHQIASIIVGSHPSGRPSDSETFWRDSEIAALSAILLHLPHIAKNPTPAMINEFISLRSIDPPIGQTESPLTREMNASPDEQVPVYWGAFTKAKRDLQGSILTGVIAKCQCFTTPNVKAVTSSEASDSRNRRFGIELSMLRHPSTAIYVVIPEGDAERYGAFLTTFFGLAMSVLRTIQVTDETVPALFLFDEAGNIPIHGLREMLGVGRGRKVAIVLAYQNLGQVYAQYGPEGGDAVLGSINTMIFLPGLDQRTTEFAARRVGRTTTLQHTTVDAVGTKNDAERLAETKRDLMDAAEIRQLVRFKQAVAIIDTAPPIKFTYPPFVQATLDELSRATAKGTPRIVSFKRAEISGGYDDDETPVENAATSPSVTEPGNTARQTQTHTQSESAAEATEDDSRGSGFERQSMKK
jgi:type IV secretory pathway TraG/TraD family ATPase VirD4